MTDTSRMSRGTPIPDTVTLHVPFRVVKRGGRKEMQLPEGRRAAAQSRTARWSRRWRAPSAGSACWRSGEFTTIAELAEREGIAPSYMTRVLRLTLLAPDIVEAILDGRQGPEVTLARVLEPLPADWRCRRGIPRSRTAHPPRLQNCALIQIG